ncbi:MAG: magnesium transporter CorA family protein [bacterium]
MYQIFKNGGFQWIDVKQAKKADLEFLKKNFDFQLKDLRASLPSVSAQRLKIKRYDHYCFIIFRFPHYNENEGTILVEEIDFFLGKNFLVSVHNGFLPRFNEIINICKKDSATLKEYLKKEPGNLLFEILEQLLKSCFPILDKISWDVSRLEEFIYQGKQQEGITDIMRIKRNVITFRRIMQSHKNVIRRLAQTEGSFFISEALRSKFNSLIQKTKDIWEILESHKEMIEALEYTNDSILSYKTNEIIKTLTMFSVTIFQMTLLATIFSMRANGGMPFLNNPYNFWIIIGLMLTIILSMLLLFKKKRWF